MQTLINNAGSGSTITIPACTFHQSVTISKPLTVNATGAVIDGDGSRATGLVILANDVTRSDIAFGVDHNAGVLLFRDGTRVEIERVTKREMADLILDAVVPRLTSTRQAGG